MKTTKKLLTTSITLILMIVVLGTGVFAWFTINTKASATQLSGTAEAADGGFYIRLKGDTNWKNTVDLSDIKVKGSKNVLKPLTTKNGSEFTNLDGKVESDGYIQFELEFLTGTKFSNVWLEHLSIVTETTTNWISEFDVTHPNNDQYNVSAGDKLNAKLSDALRVFLTDGSDTPDTTNKYIFENDNFSNEEVVVTPGNPSNLVFNNTKGYGGFALAYQNRVNQTTVTVPNEIRDAGLTDLEIGSLDSTDGVLLSIATKEVEGAQYVEYVKNTRQKLDTSFKFTTSVVIRVWLEGWDGEAFNAIASGQASLNFKFIAREE